MDELTKDILSIIANFLSEDCRDLKALSLVDKHLYSVIQQFYKDISFLTTYTKNHITACLSTSFDVSISSSTTNYKPFNTILRCPIKSCYGSTTSTVTKFILLNSNNALDGMTDHREPLQFSVSNSTIFKTEKKEHFDKISIQLRDDITKHLLSIQKHFLDREAHGSKNINHVVKQHPIFGNYIDINIPKSDADTIGYWSIQEQNVPRFQLSVGQTVSILGSVNGYCISKIDGETYGLTLHATDIGVKPSMWNCFGTCIYHHFKSLSDSLQQKEKQLLVRQVEDDADNNNNNNTSNDADNNNNNNKRSKFSV